MSTNKIGRQSIAISSKVSIKSSCAVGGKDEAKGPLSKFFDFLSEDAHFGAESWEDAESEMIRKCFTLLLEKSKTNEQDIDYIFSGDLLNQCVGSAFALKDTQIPFFGLYGACSTMAESLSLAAMSVDGGFSNCSCALTGSHFCSSERQFRLPLSYGGQRTPTAQWTATAAGGILLTNNGNGPYVTRITTGKIVDGGIGDPSNMGSAMAPAALETLCTHFDETGRSPDYYDLIVTGDLGEVGHDILIELANKNGVDLSNVYRDCGMLLFDKNSQDVHSGGSGCGCSASVLCGYLLQQMKEKKINKLLFAATGALMSPTTTLQKKSILGICHAVAIENEMPID